MRWVHTPKPHNYDIWTLRGEKFDAYVWCRGEGRWTANVDPDGPDFHNVDIHHDRRRRGGCRRGPHPRSEATTA